MCELVPFKLEHLEPLIKQRMNANLIDWYSSGRPKTLENSNSITIMIDGSPMFCGGVTEYWPGRGQLWSVFSEDSKNHFIMVFRSIRRLLKYLLDERFKRIEMSVDYGFIQGIRRANLLGFTLEVVRAKSYLPGGGDATLYSLVRGG